MTRIYANDRPFVYVNGNTQFLLTAAEAQRMVDAYKPLAFNRNRVQFIGGAILKPATLGGGDAFTIEKE